MTMVMIMVTHLLLLCGETDDSDSEYEDNCLEEEEVNGGYNLEEEENGESEEGDTGDTEKEKTDSDVDIKSSESEEISQDESAIPVTSSPAPTFYLQYHL